MAGKVSECARESWQKSRKGSRKAEKGAEKGALLDCAHASRGVARSVASYD